MATSSKSRRSSKSVVAKTSSGKTAIVRTGSKAEAKYKAQGATFSSDAGTLGSAREASKERTRARSLADPMTVLENAGGTVPSYTPPPTISSATLTPAPAINLPTAPAPSGTGTAAMTQVGGLASAPPAPEVAQADSDFKKYLKSIAKPESTADIYAKAEKEAGVQQKQQTVNNLTGQLNAIVAKSQADKLSLVGQGRGVTEAIIGGQQAQIDREAAIQSLPISAQLAAAQGDLESAQSHLETLFRIRSEDAKNKADYKNKIAETIYNYATKKQQAALDARKLQDEREFTITRDNIAYQRDLAHTALQTGQSGLLPSILGVDPNSKDFNTSIIPVASRISVPQKGSGGGGTVEERQAGAVSKLQSYLSSGQPLKDGTPAVDSNGFITPVAWNALINAAPSEGLTREKFIQSFGYLVFRDPKKGIPSSYQITPVEKKLITGEL